MPRRLKGSCRCGAVSFSLLSHTLYPYQLCYCSVCRKTAGGGGFAINIMGRADSLAIRGRKYIGVYRARIQRGARCERSSGQRNFCVRCATALWMFDPEWPELIHPFASCIDTNLPEPPSKVHLMLKYKASWVRPDFGPRDRRFQEYPKHSIAEWHRKRGLYID